MFRRILAIIAVLLVAILAAAGTWTPNNFIYKPSPGARGEAEKQTFDTGLDRIDARLGKEIWVGDPGSGTTLQSAVTVVGGNQTLLKIPAGTWSIGANFTIPANITVKLERGAILNIANGVTLSINGGLDAGLNQIFSCTGTGQVLFGAGGTREIQAAWFGTTTTDVIAALKSVPSGSTLRFIKGTYTLSVTSPIQLSNSINMVFDQGAYLDVTGAANDLYAIIYIKGSTGTAYQLGNAIVAGATSFTCNATLAASLVQGDTVFITTSNVYGGSGELWDSSNAAFVKGEFVEVLSVSGTTVSIKSKFVDSYTAANTVTMKINPVTCEIKNFRMIGTKTKNQTGLYIRYGKGIRIIGGEITGTEYTGLYIYESVDVIIDGFAASNFNGASKGTNYGIAIGSSQDVKIRNCTITGGRHAITTGGREPCRFITVEGCTLSTETSNMDALNTHPNSQFIKYVNNTVLRGGVGINGTDTEVRGNTVDGKIQYSPGARNSSYFKIVNNIVNCTDPYALYLLFYSTNVLNQLEIRGNTLTSTIGLIKDQSSCHTESTIQSVVIKDNDIRTTLRPAIYATGYSNDIPFSATQMEICGNQIYAEVNIPGGYPAGLWVSKSNFANALIINDNVINVPTPGYSFNVYLVNLTTPYVSFCRNKLYGQTEAMVDAQNETTVGKFIANDNYALRNLPNTGAGKFYIRALHYIELVHNMMDCLTPQGATLAARNILVANNKKFRINESYIYGLYGRVYYAGFSSGNVASWGTAAPTAGAWMKGDIVNKTDAAAGGSPGWVCTTSGTFGAATDNTGDTDGSTAVITGMTDTSAFYIGDWVNVSAGFPTTGPYQIIDKTSTTITLNANSNSAQSNVTVDTSDPVFKAMANVAG